MGAVVVMVVEAGVGAIVAVGPAMADVDGDDELEISPCWAFVFAVAAMGLEAETKVDDDTCIFSTPASNCAASWA